MAVVSRMDPFTPIVCSIQANGCLHSGHFFVAVIVKEMNGEDLTLVEEQLRVYGAMKFPKDFMDISEKTFSWVYDNRAEWVKFSENWKEATGLFKFWYMYVKLCRSIKKATDVQSTDGQSTEKQETPVYTIPVDDK